MYSTSPEIRSLDNTFIRPVKLKEVDEITNHNPYAVSGRVNSIQLQFA